MAAVGESSEFLVGLGCGCHRRSETVRPGIGERQLCVVHMVMEPVVWLKRFEQ